MPTSLAHGMFVNEKTRRRAKPHSSPSVKSAIKSRSSGGPGLQGAESFEYDGDAGRVVGCPRTFVDGVVMCAEHERFLARRPLPFDSSQNIPRHRRFRLSVIEPRP